MIVPRTGHAAATLPEGKVLIVGGTTLDGVVLATAEIFDPETSSTTAVAMPMATAAHGRVGHRAHRPPRAHRRRQPRHRHAGPGLGRNLRPVVAGVLQRRLLAERAAQRPHRLLLPHNAGVLVIGGTSSGVPTTASDIFVPAEFPDPYSWGMGRFQATLNTLASPRSGASAGPNGEGFAFATGGGAAGAEQYAFATVKTDKDDYAPGENALITGTGWEPGEMVQLIFQEDPAVHPDYIREVEADGDGNISTFDWAPGGARPGRPVLPDREGSGVAAQGADDVHGCSKRLLLTFAGSGGGTVTITRYTGSARAGFMWRPQALR